MLFPEKYSDMIMSEACEHGTLCPQRGPVGVSAEVVAAMVAVIQSILV